MSIAVSVRHLREVISQRLQQKFPDDTVAIPSGFVTLSQPQLCTTLEDLT